MFSFISTKSLERPRIIISLKFKMSFDYFKSLVYIGTTEISSILITTYSYDPIST